MKEKQEKWEGIRLSPSSINTYLRCPRDFYYKYVLRLPTPPSKHLIKGNIVHKCLEEFFKENYSADLDKKMEEILEKVWTDFLPEWKGLEDDLVVEKGDCKNQLELYMWGFKRKIKGLIDSGKVEDERHAWYILKPKMREMWIEDKELNLCGYIDRVHKDFDGSIVIGDYKTSSRYGIGMKDEYLNQCAIYALLYSRKTGEIPQWVSIIYTRYGEEVMTRVTPELIQRAIDITKYVHSKTQTDNIEDYPCSQDALCSYSPWFNKKSGLCDIEDEERRKKVFEELGITEEKD